ncbi:hypothetical protein O181_064051 [Austropuccinia psidii MF-1]|uniref:Uncharacterized protein n=1 Tax=Austropuccinia psidii MF-1 TaxID=1389203 RepID=A0A9Q3HZX9_9BASI|nr:hypothetical protein [Austropuccinia psidii MF-1]
MPQGHLTPIGRGGPSYHFRGLWPLPSYPGPLSHPFAPTGHTPWDLLGPFCLKSNKEKWGHTCGSKTTFWPPILKFQNGHGPSRINPLPMVATRGHQPPSKGSLPKTKETLPQKCRKLQWAYMVLYTIMHHFSREIQW